MNWPHRAMEIWLVWKLIPGWAVLHTQFTMDFLCPLKCANVIMPLVTELMSVHIYSCLGKFCRRNPVISTLSFMQSRKYSLPSFRSYSSWSSEFPELEQQKAAWFERDVWVINALYISIDNRPFSPPKCCWYFTNVTTSLDHCLPLE